MKSITADCPHCKKPFVVATEGLEPIHCPYCHQVAGHLTDWQAIFECCAICQCRQFYVQKDFNRGLGCLIMLTGIILVPKTYGLSLPIFALFDLFLYRKYQTMVICYRCGAEYRGFPAPAHLKPFLHHIGLKYDRYR